MRSMKQQARLCPQTVTPIRTYPLVSPPICSHPSIHTTFLTHLVSLQSISTMTPSAPLPCSACPACSIANHAIQSSFPNSAPCPLITDLCPIFISFVAYRNSSVESVISKKWDSSSSFSFLVGQRSAASLGDLDHLSQKMGRRKVGLSQG